MGEDLSLAVDQRGRAIPAQLEIGQGFLEEFQVQPADHHLALLRRHGEHQVGRVGNLQTHIAHVFVPHAGDREPFRLRDGEQVGEHVVTARRVGQNLAPGADQDDFQDQGLVLEEQVQLPGEVVQVAATEEIDHEQQVLLPHEGVVDGLHDPLGGFPLATAPPLLLGVAHQQEDRAQAEQQEDQHGDGEQTNHLAAQAALADGCLDRDGFGGLGQGAFLRAWPTAPARPGIGARVGHAAAGLPGSAA